MFTGLIEEVGTLEKIRKQGETLELTIRAKKVLEDAAVGDSIAVNGVCLTAVKVQSETVVMEVMPETFRKTTLGRLSPGDKVNLERAMQAGARFGGHIVQGHVDGIGIVKSRTPEQNAVYFEIEPKDAGLMRYIIPKGSIALDGISLTVVDAAQRTFRVSIIPHTLAATAIGERKPGDAVNLETDIIGKYVEHLLKKSGQGGGLTEHFLREHGF